MSDETKNKVKNILELNREISSQYTELKEKCETRDNELNELRDDIFSLVGEINSLNVVRSDKRKIILHGFSPLTLDELKNISDLLGLPNYEIDFREEIISFFK